MWLETETGNYVNLAAVGFLEVVNDGGAWKVQPLGQPSWRLAGVSETSQAGAQDVLRRLVQGVQASAIL